MDLIKKIKTKKKDRNIIIYDTINELNKIKNYDLKNWLSSSIPIYSVYYNKAYNPSFFNNIICIKKLNDKDLQENMHKLWNMVLFGGYIFTFSTLGNYLKKYIIYKKDDYVLIKKTNSIVFQFIKYKAPIDFIIAGTMKSGTTSAMEHFDNHPEISMPKEEIHYFDIKENYQKGIEWYKSHFNYNKKMIGDKAPDVMYIYSCLELLQIVNPQVKIILFLKNPIERAYSHWKMTRDLFGNRNSFEFCINDEIEHRMKENRSYHVSFFAHFIKRGFYYEQIMEILKYFPRENLNITISEIMEENTDKSYQNIFKFLNVKEYHSNFNKRFVSKSKNKLNKEGELYLKLQKIFDSDKKKLEKFLGYKTGWW